MAECHKRREMPRQFSVVLRLLFEEERARHLVDQRDKGREASVKGTRIKSFLPSAEDDRITVDPYSDMELIDIPSGSIEWCREGSVTMVPGIIREVRLQVGGGIQ